MGRSRNYSELASTFMKKYFSYIIIVILASILFIHSIGTSPLFDWDEINFAESAREMIVSGDYLRVQINYQPFWEKPPLFFWMQVVSMKIFGINEFAARFPNAICGIVTLLVFYHLGSKMRNRKFAFWWVLLYVSSFLPHLYFKSGIIDPWFNLFIFLGIYYLSDFLENIQVNQKKSSLVVSGIFTGLSILTKGPVGLLIVLLTYIVYIILNKGKGFVALKYYFQWVLTVLAITLIWFGLEIFQHGWWFINEFFSYQVRLAKTEDAGHGGFPLYHFVVLFFGCFPASIFLLNRPTESSTVSSGQVFKKMMWASLIVILTVFSLVKTKIVHYSSFAYFPLVYLATESLFHIIEHKSDWRKSNRALLFVIYLIWASIFILLPILFINVDWLKQLASKDQFALANLNANVYWGYFYLVSGIIFVIGGLTAYFLFSRSIQKGIFMLLITSTITIQSLLTFFVPQIELYTQDAAIEFFKSLRGKDVYVRALGYKSYAPYFYAQVNPPPTNEAYDIHWLIYGEVEKPVYLVTRLDRKAQVMRDYGEQLKILYEKNGFVFLERKNY